VSFSSALLPALVHATGSFCRDPAAVYQDAIKTGPPPLLACTFFNLWARSFRKILYSVSILVCFPLPLRTLFRMISAECLFHFFCHTKGPRTISPLSSKPARSFLSPPPPNGHFFSPGCSGAWVIFLIEGWVTLGSLTVERFASS